MQGPTNPIAGRYAVDVAKPLAGAGGGVSAFSVTDLRSSAARLMALRVARHFPARHRHVQAPFFAIDGLLCPLAHGVGPTIDGDAGYFVICSAPTGAPVSAGLHAWSEQALIEQVLKPVARVLEQLHQRGLTHRGIRPNNVFLPGPGEAVVLGAAWATPPAVDQPALFEPPYSAMCAPECRGEGSIADDVYALGVLLLTLATGHVPNLGANETVSSLRKLEMGSAAALIGTARLPPTVGDLILGMLAEDPDHRPLPSLLLDPASARGRKVAARPPRRAQRPIQVGAMSVANARMLAYALAMQPDAGVHMLRGSAITQWVRRDIGDPALGGRLEELQRFRVSDAPAEDARADATLLMRCVVLLDPLAPMCWRGLCFWLDAIGPALAVARVRSERTHPGAVAPILEDAIAADMIGQWALQRDSNGGSHATREEFRLVRGWLQKRGAAGGPRRLFYGLNPLSPCDSPILSGPWGGHWVATMADLVPALDAAMAANPTGEPIDAEILAFVAARSDRHIEKDINILDGTRDAEDRLLSVLRLLSEFQARFHPYPTLALAAWTVRETPPLLARWQNPRRRAAITERLRGLSAVGILTPMFALLQDTASLEVDRSEVQAVESELARLDLALKGIEGGSQARAAMASRIGQEIAAGLGLTALALALLAAAFG